ncbi:hypothetical protein MHYP_G00226720 [Metynnis hypsauchen]
MSDLCLICWEKTNEQSRPSLLWRDCSCQAGAARPERRLRFVVVCGTGVESASSGLLSDLSSRGTLHWHGLLEEMFVSS